MLTGVATSPGVGVGPAVRLPAPAGNAVSPRGVVIAADLGPAEMMALDLDGVTAVATAAGAPLSHAAIVARVRGIPLVTGLGQDVLALQPGTIVMVDGDAGQLHVEPSADMLDDARRRGEASRATRERARRDAGAAATTGDGHTILVTANVGSTDEAATAVREGADGIGMLRTEFVFLNRTDPPGEDEQYDAYRRVAAAVGDRPLVVRTLDLGADIPAWGAGPEPNPALGNRGLRLCLASGALFTPQLRAIARLAQHRPVQVMFPMVTTVDELRQARAQLDRVRPPDATLEVGITVEVPSAAIMAGTFAPLVDFFAVGTNDLTQYTLATDRANAAVAGLADGLHPAVLRLVREVTAAGAQHGRPVGTVGELGCDPVAIPVLLGLGVTNLSVRPNAVAAVKQAIRAITLGEARDVAAAALQSESASAVRKVAGAISRTG